MSHTSDTTTIDPLHDDEEWTAATGRRSRWRVALLAMLAVTVVFLAGAQVQKHFGATSSTSTTATGGPGQASFGGGQGAPTGFPQAAGSNQASSGTVPGTSGQTSAASVIGTVTKISGHRLIVKDLGGKTHTVTLQHDTKIIRETTVKSQDIKSGSTVAVTGASDTSQTVTATSITIR